MSFTYCEACKNEAEIEACYPSYVVRILGYSLTLQLDFTKLVALTFLLGVGVALWIRYRVLNKYSDLKEPPYVSTYSKSLNHVHELTS